MVFSFIMLKGNAQPFNPKQVKLFKIVSDTLVLDSLSIVPESITFKTFPADDSTNIPTINYKLHALIFSGKKPDSLIVSYKRFPYNFEKNYFEKVEPLKKLLIIQYYLKNSFFIDLKIIFFTIISIFRIYKFTEKDLNFFFHIDV